MTCNCQKTEVCLDYHEDRNAKYLSLLIAKATITEGYYQELFRKKERKRVNKSSEIKGKIGKLL